MQAVILAAGEGKRMLPLTLATPKPLLKVADRPILEHIIDALPPEITEVVLVIGYRGDVIKAHLGEGLRKGRMITYVTQETPKGTYDALLQARPLLDGTFMLLNGDDLHSSDSLAEAITHPLALITSRHEEPGKFGLVKRKEDGTLHAIIEKPEDPDDTLVSTGAMVLDDRIFGYEVLPAANGEYYLPVALKQLAQEHAVQVVEEAEWIPIGYPEDLSAAELILQARKPEEELGDLSDTPLTAPDAEA